MSDENKIPLEPVDAKEIGKHFGLSERSIDVLLKTYGFQTEVHIDGASKECYVPTKGRGSAHCDSLKIMGYTEDDEPYYRPLWRDTIYNALRAYI
jgi:hypothetical protein